MDKKLHEATDRLAGIVIAAAELVRRGIVQPTSGVSDGRWPHEESRSHPGACHVCREDWPCRVQQLATSRDAFRHTSGLHLDRLRELEEIDKEHANCAGHIAALSDHAARLTKERDALRSAAIEGSGRLDADQAVRGDGR